MNIGRQSMHGRKFGGIPSRFAAAARQFAEWRKTQKRGTRIPESLWVVAVDVARSEGVWRTARTLRLDYYGLKRRLEADSAPSHAAKVGRPNAPFIEIAPSIMASLGECLIEMEDGDGSKMRIHLKGSCYRPNCGRAFANERSFPSRLMDSIGRIDSSNAECRRPLVSAHENFLVLAWIPMRAIDLKMFDDGAPGANAVTALVEIGLSRQLGIEDQLLGKLARSRLPILGKSQDLVIAIGSRPRRLEHIAREQSFSIDANARQDILAVMLASCESQPMFGGERLRMT